MQEVKDFIYSYEGEQKEIMLFFHQLLLELNLYAKISYGIPFYYKKSWICYMNPRKNGSIEFAFTRGNELSNSQGILNDKGRKQVSSTEVKRLKEIPLESIQEIIHEAILLDNNVPYSVKKS